MSQSIARRYARAIIELIAPTQYEAYAATLLELSKLWDRAAELRSALKNPGYAQSDRRAALEQIVSTVPGADQKIKNLMSLLLENDRLNLLPHIAQSFAEMVAEIRKLLSLQVISASELNKEEQSSLSAEVQKTFGSMASIQWKVDKSILGGLQVKVGDRMLDSSVDGALTRLQSQLFGARV